MKKRFNELERFSVYGLLSPQSDSGVGTKRTRLKHQRGELGPPTSPPEVEADLLQVQI